MNQIPEFESSLAGRREWWGLAALVLVVLLLAIDGTVLYLAVPSMTADIGPNATELLWIGDVYSSSRQFWPGESFPPPVLQR